MKKLAFVLAVSATLIAHGADERPQEVHDPDVQRLLKVSRFAFGPVGIAGITSEGEAAFGRIVRKREAIRFIMAAFEYGDAHARCYALVALREVSPELFRAAIASTRKAPSTKIATMSGCIVSFVEIEKVLAAIEAGAYSADFKRHEGKG